MSIFYFPRLLCLALCALFIAGCAAQPLRDKLFTFQGKPIHPGCISEFEVWLSDTGPPRVHTIDLASAIASNKNFAAPTHDPAGDLVTTNDDGSFAYKCLGVTSTGTYVLLTKSWGRDGSMVAEDIFLIRMGNEKYFEVKDGAEKPMGRERSVLTCIGQIVVGDRDEGSMKLQGDALTLGKSQSRNAAVTYHLP